MMERSRTGFVSRFEGVCGLNALLCSVLLFSVKSPTKVFAETPPIIDIADAAVAEGNSDRTNIIFRLTLSKAISRSVMVDYATRDVTASAGSDYSPAFGVAIFEPGITNQEIAVSVNGDAVDEPDEIFFVNLGRPVNATIIDGIGVGTIVDDDPP